MLERDDPTLHWRGLLTETLPYEVPVIFSNDLLYASLVKPSADAQVSRIVNAMRSKLYTFSIPYSYRIAKDERRYTSLAIIHPNQQLQISEFYEFYKQSVLDYCNRSEATLRRPISEMPVYSGSPLDEEQTDRLGIPHINPEDGEIDVSRMISYFSYGRYNLLGKFIDSVEYRKLEKQFGFLRTIDVSKCFFNIYTHSIAWAVKGKHFAKEQGDVYSFETSFDRLMQRSNYNETNGIVVGPEISRIFAEIILQDVDRRLIDRMKPAVHGVDFAMRRYVDDFFIFAPNELVLDQIAGILDAELERYKLFVNSEKTETFARPFVSAITLARSELRTLTAEMHAVLDALSGDVERARIRRSVADLRRMVLDIRLTSSRYKVGFNSISGWLLTTLRTLLVRAIGMINAAATDEERSGITDMAITILEIAFYIAALDTRVRTTYNICQIVGVLNRLHGELVCDSRDRLLHAVGEELGGMIQALLKARKQDLPPNAVPNQASSVAPRPASTPSGGAATARPAASHGGSTAPIGWTAEPNDDIELYNLMIIGAHFLSSDFLKVAPMREALSRIRAHPTTYFSYITEKFCLLKDQNRHASVLQQLNVEVRAKIIEGSKQIDRDAQLYLLACDYLSAPDIAAADKRTLIENICGGQPSNLHSVSAGNYLGFVDWSGVRISHVMARKQLRPVYSWS